MLTHAMQAAALFNHSAAVKPDDLAVRIHAFKVSLCLRIIRRLVLRENQRAIHINEVHVAGRQNLPVVELALRRQRQRIHLGLITVMTLEPGFYQILRFSQNDVVRRTLVRSFAHHDAILSHKTSHVIDMAVRMVAMQSVGENQHVAETESLAKGLDHLLDVFRVVAVLACQAIQRGNAEAVAVDFNGSTFKNVGNACTFLVFNLDDA